MPQREWCAYGDRQTGPGQQARDRLGEEMAENARIWKIYVDEARRHDDTMLKDWNSSIDTLLIFAGLFSAVSTAFIVEAYRLMQPDYTELTFRALMANSSHPFVPEPFVVPGAARTVNCLWIASLIASLFTALVGILAKQWLSAYTSDRMGGSLRQWAQLRQFRFDSVRQWRVPEMIALLPVLLHASLLLFLAGLVLFLAPIDLLTAMLAFMLSFVVYLTYAATTFSPLLWPSSPFRSQLTPIMQQCWDLFVGLVRRQSDPDEAADADDLWRSIPAHDEPQTLASALSWLNQSTRSPDMFTALLNALGDVNLGRPTAQCLPLTMRQSILDSIQSETHYDRLHKTRIPTERLSRYFRAVSNIVTSDDDAHRIGSQFAHALVKRAMAESDARTPELGDIAIHGLLYIKRFAPYISIDWQLLVSLSSAVKVGKVTALAVVSTLREMRHDPWEKQLETLLWIVHHFLPHFEAKPDVIVDCVRQLLPVEIVAELERHGRGLIAVLCFLLTCEHAAIAQLIRQSEGLEAAVVSSLVALCAGNDTHNHRFASLAKVFSCERRVHLHCWTCEDVAGAVNSIDLHGADEACAAQAVANLLHPGLAWHRTKSDAASASQSAALGRCAEAIQLILMMHKTKPSIGVVLDRLLSNAALVSLSRAAGHSVPALPRVLMQVASTFHSLQSHGMEGEANVLLGKFIFTDVSVGDDDKHVVARWDLVTSATHACVQVMDGVPKPNPHLFKALVTSFVSLQAMAPSQNCWRAIAQAIHAELTPERKHSLERAKGSYKSWGPAALDYAAILETFNVAVGFSPTEREQDGVIGGVPTPPATPSRRGRATSVISENVGVVHHSHDGEVNSV